MSAHALQSTAVALSAVLLVLIVASLVSYLLRGKARLADVAHRSPVESTPPPPKPLIVAPNMQMALLYARREGVPLRSMRMATEPHQMQGHRGPVVMLQGESSLFDYRPGVLDALQHLRMIGCPITYERF